MKIESVSRTRRRTLRFRLSSTLNLAPLYLAELFTSKQFSHFWSEKPGKFLIIVSFYMSLSLSRCFNMKIDTMSRYHEAENLSGSRTENNNFSTLNFGSESQFRLAKFNIRVLKNFFVVFTFLEDETLNQRWWNCL